MKGHLITLHHGDSATVTTMQGAPSLQRQRAASELVHTNVTVDTRDHEDHTFAGIMFDVKASASMPIEYIEIQAIHGIHCRCDLQP
jgi:hypothetical protein